MSCDIFHLEDPATGQIVSVITESDGSLSFLNPDGTVFAGDPATLTTCGSEETVTNIVLAVDGSSFTYTNEEGVDVLVPLSGGGGPDVGQSVVEDNGDSTTTITGTATDGTVTTGIVINDLRVNNGGYGIWRSVNPGLDIFITEANIIDGTVTDSAVTASVEKLADGTLAVKQTVTLVYKEGDTLSYDVVLDDGSTLTAGTAVPVGNVIVSEENLDGTLAYFKAIDICDCEGGGVDPNTCPATQTAQCCELEQSFDDAALGAAPAAGVTSMTEVFAEQFGDLYNAASSEDVVPIPYNFNLPAATQDCVVIFQVTWGEWEGSGTDDPLGDLVTVTSTGGNLSTPQFIVQSPVFSTNNSGGSRQAIFCADVLGSGGDSVTIDFPNSSPGADGFADGIFILNVHEVCGISCSDLMTGGIVESNDLTMSADMGECDALVFSSARHIEDCGQSGNYLLDCQFTQITDINLAIAHVSQGGNQNKCQLGAQGGWIAGGSGQQDVTYDHNTNHDGQTTAFIPINCSGAGGLPTQQTSGCSIDMSNTCPDTDQMVESDIAGQVCIDAAVGSSFAVTPVINGVPVTASTVTLDNTGGTTTVSQCFPASAAVNLPSSIAGGASVPTQTFSWQVETLAHVASPDNQVVVGDWCGNTTLSSI